MASEEEAAKMIPDLTALCHKGGFTLSKWVSNSRALLCSVSEAHRAKDMMELDLDTYQLPVEHTIGLQWYIETDLDLRLRHKSDYRQEEEFFQWSTPSMTH